jgi:hypothetical protein
MALSNWKHTLSCLNYGSKIHIYDVTGPMAALDLRFVNSRLAVLDTWKVETDPLRLRGRLYDKDTDWSAIMEK